jgi:DNA polymerase III sliding clamp (beta) subunit (PCNA family)
MKINAVELLSALNKVSGVVNDKSVVEELKAFHLLPENGILKVAGTDSNMTIIEKVAYEETENSDGTKLVLSANKIMDVIRYAGHEIEFVYNAEDTDGGVKIVSPTSSVTLFKHFGIADEIINFELDAEEDFEDEIKVSELKSIFSNLSAVVDTSVTDPSFKTIFFNGEKALVGDETTISTIECTTNGKYEFGIKVVKQTLSILNGLDPESFVKLKKIDEGSKILLKTDSDVLSFGIADVMEPNLEVIEQFVSVASVLVSKEDFNRSINLVRATSEEDKINVELTEDKTNLTSYFEGEEARDELVNAKSQIKVENGFKFESLASQLLKLNSIIDSEGVVLEVDNESNILLVRDPKKKVVSAISVRQ